MAPRAWMGLWVVMLLSHSPTVLSKRAMLQSDAISNSNGCLESIQKCEEGACATRNIMGTARWVCLRCLSNYEPVVDSSGQQNIIQCGRWRTGWPWGLVLHEQQQWHGASCHARLDRGGASSSKPNCAPTAVNTPPTASDLPSVGQHGVGVAAGVQGRPFRRLQVGQHSNRLQQGPDSCTVCPPPPPAEALSHAPRHHQATVCTALNQL